MIDLRFQPMQVRVKDPLGRKHYLPSPFSKQVGAGYDQLEKELSKLQATGIVVESGHDRTQIRNDGWPRSSSSPAHPDIRLYFKCRHGSLKYECNAFSNWEANLRAIGLWLQRQRLALEEWGVGAGGEAYRGFAALPPGREPIAAAEWPSVEDAMRWLSRIGEGPLVSSLASDLNTVYRQASKKAHPDAGGSEELMARVNRARDYIERAGTGEP